MKKITKIVVILAIAILFVSNMAFAVETPDLNIVFDQTALEELQNSDDQDASLINTENGIMPISEDALENGEENPIPEEWLRDVDETDEDDEDDDFDDFEIDESEQYIGDMFKTEENLEIEKDVYGDVFVIAKSLEITSDVIIDGNVFVIAEDLKISGTVYSYVYALANNIEVTGTVNGMYALAKNKITISEDAEVIRDLKLAGEEININGMVDRNVLIASENINLGEGSVIYGQFTYSGNLNGNTDGIYGETVKYEITDGEEKEEPTAKEIIIADIMDVVIKAIIALIFIALIVGISKSNKSKFDSMKPIDYVKDLLIGISFIIVVPVVAIILMFTLIGIPFALIILAIYIVILYLALTFLSFEIAKAILKESNSKLKTIGVALLVYIGLEILSLIPVCGGIIGFLATLLGVSAELKIFKKNKAEKAPEVVKEVQKVESKTEEKKEIEDKAENKEEVKEESKDENETKE